MKAVISLLVSAGVILAIGLPYVFSRHDGEPEPTFIPGKVATTDDIQEFDLHWAEFEKLQKKAKELGGEEFKKQALANSLEYLQFEPEDEAKFVTAVENALVDLQKAREAMYRVNVDSAEMEESEAISARANAWRKWQQDQREISAGLLDYYLFDDPRHGLMADQSNLWLLSLDYSVRDGDRP